MTPVAQLCWMLLLMLALDALLDTRFIEAAIMGLVLATTYVYAHSAAVTARREFKHFKERWAAYSLAGSPLKAIRRRVAGRQEAPV